MKNLNEYSLKELKEAIRLKERENIFELEVAKKYVGRYILTEDLTYILSGEFLGDGRWVNQNYWKEYLERNIRYYSKGDCFTISIEENRIESNFYFKAKFDNGHVYYSWHGLCDLEFILEFANRLET